MIAAVAPVTLSAPTIAAPISVRDLVELTDVDSVSVAPDGRFALFRTVRADLGRNSYVLNWHAVDLNSGDVRDAGSGGLPIYHDPGLLLPEKVLWGADSRTFVVRALVDGAVGLWRGDVMSHQLRPLVDGDADVIDADSTSDHHSIIYRVGATRAAIRRAEQAEYDEGILVDRSVDLSQNLFRGGSINGRMATQRLVGYWLVRDGLLWRAPRQERRVDLQTGTDTLVGSPQDPPSFDLAHYLEPDRPADAPGTVAIVSETAKRSISVQYASGQTVRCRDPLCASQALAWWAWHPGSRDLVLAFKDRQLRQSLYLWDTAANRLRLIVSSQGLLSGSRNDYRPCAIAMRFALCVAAEPGSPPRVERIDLGTGDRTGLYDPNAHLRSTYRPGVGYLQWPIIEGREAAGILLQPASHPLGGAPLFVNYNRCDGFLRGGEGNEWPIPSLVGAGYAIACINAVPVDGPQDAVHNYRLALSAVETLVDRLSDAGSVDRRKVAMGGLSFGSEAAFWVAIHSNLLAALSVSSPQFEPGEYWRRAMPGSDMPAAMLKVWGLGDPALTRNRWHEVSPALNAQRIRIPVLFQMPEQEARQGPQLFSRLAAQGTPTELYAYPDEGHIKIQPRHQLAVYQRNLDWFRYWLEDYRDETPEKRDQYRRWDALKARWTATDGRPRIEATTPRRSSR